MNRRRFLQAAALAPGSLVLPAWLAGCKEEDWLADGSFSGKVAIVGAGASGLYAAYLLHRRGLDVTVFEASARHGGRIRSLDDFADFPVELGAEEIHGSHSVLYDIARAGGASFVDAPLEDLVSLDGVLRTEVEATADPDMQLLEEALAGVATYTGPDIHAQAYANVVGLPGRVSHVFNARIANENGTSATRIGMAGLRDAEQQWIAGEANHVPKNRTMLQLLEERFASILPLIRYETPVIRIAYGGNRVVLTLEDGSFFSADRVLVTASVRVLYDQLIDFVPALPAPTQQAINTIGMDAGMKVVLKFQQRFWPAGMGSLFTEGLVPEYWAPGAGGKSAAHNVLTGFVMGEKAEILSGMPDGERLAALLAELDGLFGGLASPAYADHYVMDWKNEPWIRGAYSYPRPGTADARFRLARPVLGKVFFAGEATHTQGHHGTVHGALETSARAVREILMS